MNRLLLSLGAVLLLSLSACGGGGSTATTAATAGNTINGVANLGVVSNGVVTAYKLTATGTQGAKLGSATSNPDGTFSINVGTYTGPCVLVLSNNASSNATFINEATGAATALPAAAANSTVSSVLSSVAANQNAAITPLTDIIATAAMKSAANGSAPAAAIQQAKTLVANAFGLNGIDPLTTKPANLKVSAGTGNAAKYASVLAGIARVAGGASPTVNPGPKLIAQTKAYATAMFNTKGAPQAPTALTTANNFKALKTAITAFIANPKGLQAPTVTVTPTGATYAGNTYYYTVVDYQSVAPRIDYLERGTLTMGTKASVIPAEGWVSTTKAPLMPKFKAPLTINPNGSWSVASVTTVNGPTSPLKGNISADGLVFAGAGIVAGATSNTIIYGVKKPATNVTKAALANKSFKFVTQGSSSSLGGGIKSIEDTGSITFSANGSTLTYVLNESVNGAAPVTTTTANQAYTITVDGLIKMTYTTANGGIGVTYLALSEGLKYGVYTEANYNTAAGTQFKNAGLLIASTNITPNVAKTKYNYFASYYANGNSSLNVSVTGVGGTGPQIEQALLSFNAQQTATLVAASPLDAMQLLYSVGLPPAVCGILGKPLCGGANATFIFAGKPNGAFTISDGQGGTFSGFASADGTVVAVPGLIAIRQ